MIVERDELLTMISDRIAAAHRGNGSLVLLAGEAGAGKTALIKESRARAGSAVTVVEGACDPLTTARPLGPFLEIASHPDLYLGHLDPATTAPSDLFTALLDELSARSRPVLLTLEDLHWADDATLDMVRFLGRRVDRTRAVIIATYRSDETLGDRRLAPVLNQLLPMATTHPIDVPPLTVEGVRELVTRGESAAGVAPGLDPALIHRRTGGNPFFVTEVLASGGAAVPATVQSAVTGRVASLPAGAKRLVEATAVSPRALEYDYAISLSEADESDIDAATETGMLSMDRGRFRFRHELARLAVEQATPPSRRRRYHRAMTDLLVEEHFADAPRIAHHAIELGDGDLVVRFAVEAADTAQTRGSNREARDFLAQAFRYADTVDPATAAQWRIRLGSLNGMVGDLPQARRLLQEAVDDARQRGDDVTTSVALRLLSGICRDLGQTALAGQLADEAIEVAAAADDQEELAQALTHAAFLAMLRRQGRVAVELAEQALAIAEAGGHDAIAANTEHALACARLIGGHEDDAVDALTTLERAAAKRGDHHGRTRLAVNLGSGCGEIRRYDQADHWLEVARGLGVTLDLDQAAAYSSAWMARVAFETGRWDEVAELAAPASGYEPGDVERLASYAQVTALGAVGRTRIRRGDPGGDRALHDALERGADHDFQYLWPIGCGLAEHAFWRGEPETGRQWLGPIHQAALETESTWGRGETSYWMWRLGSLTEADNGNGNGNNDNGNNDNGNSDSGGTATPAIATPAIDSLAEPFGLAIAGRWEEAAGTWERLGCPYEQALSLADGGRLDSLTRAIELFDGLGARPAAAWARQRLREVDGSSVPAMPRASTAANPASLTKRQHEVLELLVEGASNQEIADRLFVSKKTVEHHVSAIYSKLGVPDRPAAMVAGRRLLSG